MNEEYVKMLEERICKLEVQLEQSVPRYGSIKSLLDKLRHEFNQVHNKYDVESKAKKAYISNLISYYETVKEVLERKKLNKLQAKRNRYITIK